MSVTWAVFSLAQWTASREKIIVWTVHPCPLGRDPFTDMSWCCQLCRKIWNLQSSISTIFDSQPKSSCNCCVPHLWKPISKLRETHRKDKRVGKGWAERNVETRALKFVYVKFSIMFCLSSFSEITSPLSTSSSEKHLIPLKIFDLKDTFHL